MITMRRRLLGLGVAGACSLLALHSAQAMTGPTAIQIDGGPVGALQLSGGFDGYGYYLGNVGNGVKDNGAEVGSALIELQKTSGVLQFTVEVGSNGGATTVGTTPSQTSTTTFTTGPLYAGYVTIAPTGMPFTVSAGQLASLEGFESGVDWNNADQLTTAIFYVQNSQNRGVSANYTEGPVSATLTFGDGYDSGVFNFLQALVTYTINSSNNLNIYYAGNLGTTGLNTYAYGNSTTAAYGPQFVNSQMIGGYYSYTKGNLNLVPEVQFQYAKANTSIGLDKPMSNFGAALFGDYTFGTSPYSIGGWAEYFTSHESTTEAMNGLSWFVGPDAQAVGASVAPTWQYKDVFARANAGVLYLLKSNSPAGSFGYGNSGTDKATFIGTLEAGVLF
jgi:hypothetical protein